MNWWNELTGLQQVFASVAIPSTLVMVVQFILFMLGFSHGEGADSGDTHVDLHVHDGPHGLFEGHGQDFSGGHEELSHIHDGTCHHGEAGSEPVDALRLFTLRGIIAFLAVGGWMGVASISWKVPAPAVFLLVMVSGFLALYFVAWSVRLALRMQQSGNVLIENAVGKEGEVYIPIPRSKIGQGKINVIVQERLCEFDAVTEAERTLKTGEKITVMGVFSEGVLLAMPKNSPPEGVIIEKY